MRLYPIDDPQHSEAAELLPWFANGTLDESERTKVERHLADCIACKQDLVDLRNVQAMFSAEAMDQAASEGLARVRGRIASLEPGRERVVPRASLARSAPRWWQTLLVGQGALILMLAAALLMRPEPRYYHTQAAATVPARPAGPGVVVIFDAGRPEGEIRELLRSLHAHVVDGPSVEGAYTMQVPAGEEAHALTELRQRSWVRFAEPALGSSMP
jgi:anti-sigma factor RsiW